MRLVSALGGRRRCCLWWLLLVLFITYGLGRCYECGGFFDVGKPGSFQSPGYPGNYPNYSRCIWIMEAPVGHVPRLNVTFQGQAYNTECSDYVEFRDGGQIGDVIVKNCAVMRSQVVISTSRWMYVYFRSDGLGQAEGLLASYTALYVGNTNSNVASPVRSCRSFEVQCSNRLCVSRAYRCDGFYDCGCGSGCDEDQCAGLQLSEVQMMTTGTAVGVLVFLLAAAGGLLLEKRHHWEGDKDDNHTGGWSLPGRRGRRAGGRIKGGSGSQAAGTAATGAGPLGGSRSYSRRVTRS